MLHAHLIIARIDPSDGGPAPEWILLFKAGENEIEGEGRYLVDRSAFELVAAEFRRRGNDIVVDYEHQTLKDLKAPAAGWIKVLDWQEGRGILARVEWTEAAAAMIQAREYRYHSPVFYIRQSDRRLAGLHSVALTNAPKTNHLAPLLAKLGDIPKEETMDLLKKLLEALGLAPDANEETALAAVAKLKARPEKPITREVVAKEVLEVLELAEGEGVSTVVASINALKQAPKGMVSREEFAALQAKLTQREADEAVTQAMAAGKITPDQKDWALAYAKSDAEGFAAFVAKAPVVIPLGKLPRQTKAPDPATNELQLKINKLMGIDPEAWKKYGPQESA